MVWLSLQHLAKQLNGHGMLVLLDTKLRQRQQGRLLLQGELFALGGVAHKPWRNTAAEAALVGQLADAGVFARAADIVLRDAKGFGHNTFKIDLARRVIVRALSQAARGTPQSQSNKKIA